MTNPQAQPPRSALADPTAAASDCVLAVDLGGTNLRLGLADRSGRMLAQWSASSVGVRDPRRIVDLIAAGMEHLLGQAARPRDHLRAVGLGAPGITDVERGIVLQTSYLLGWTDVPIVSMLEARLNIPAAVDNDVNVALLGELSVGLARNESDVLMVAVGTGIGAAIQVDGRMVRGRNWMAGEIGYMLVPGLVDTPVADDAPGALESAAGGYAIEQQWRRLAQQHAGLSPELRATEIFDLAQAGHPQASGLLSHVAQLLGAALYNVCLVVDVPLVVLSGSVGVHPALHKAVEETFARRRRRDRPRLLASQLGTGAQLAGAAELAWRRLAMEPHSLS